MADVSIAEHVESNSNLRPRKPSDGSWIWEHKAARYRIREACDGQNNVATALSVYGALAEVSSDARSPTFTTTHAHLASLSGPSVRTVQKHLKTFVEIQLLEISTPVLKQPSTYTLLACSSEGLRGNRCGSIRNPGPNRTLPTLEEDMKNKNKKPQESAQGEAAPICSDLPQITAAGIYNAYPRKQAKARALRAIEAAFSKVKPEYLLDRAAAYSHAVGQWPAEDRRYIPLLENWIESGSYEDDPQCWTRGTPSKTESPLDTAF